ncbi:MAG TPA: twin-arginine translocase TatA/TatE family subunit [Candidatus Acidoferrum sp.]|jgi:sec-independent protein translocase protein TatB
MLSIPHMIVVFIIVLVVFGPQKLPELARGLGKLMAEFRKASTDFKSAFEQEMRDMERQARETERRKAAEAAAATATPAQPATLGTPSGSETASPEAPLADPAPDTRATEAPLIVPVPEALPRGSEADFASEAPTAAVPPESAEKIETSAAAKSADVTS